MSHLSGHDSSSTAPAGRFMLHRRIDVSGGFSADADWAGTHTLPNLYPATTLALGGVRPFTATAGAALIWIELFDGMGDDAEPVAPGAMTWSGMVVSWTADGANTIFAVGDAVSGVLVQKRQIEDELSPLRSAVRLTAAASIPVEANAIWIYVDTSVVV